jgi:predicted amidophosphoribosyltransferase
MSAISISFGLLIALVGVLVFYRMHKLPQIAGYGSQRMCPSCGLITSRLKACCLECGKSLTAVSVTPIVEK